MTDDFLIAFLQFPTRLLQLLSCDHLIALHVFVDDLLYHILRESPVVIRICLQPIPCILFVEGGLAMTRLIGIGCPETGAVRSQHLVCKDDVAFLVEAKLKLGVRNDDTAASRIISTLRVKSDGVVPKLGGILLSLSGIVFLQVSDALLVGDVLVVLSKVGLG